MSGYLPGKVKETANLWREAFAAVLLTHLRSSAFRINMAVIALAFGCSLRAGLLVLGSYGALLLSHLVTGVHALCLYGERRQQGLPVRSSRDADEVFEQFARMAAGRLWIAVMAAVLLLTDWQAFGAEESARRLVELAGDVFLVIAGMQVLGTATHPVTWQELFDSETGAFKGGRS